MADLKTNYVDDVLDSEKNQLRKYQMIHNDDGTVSFVDVTTYSQVGDNFSAIDINSTNTKVNENSSGISNNAKEISSIKSDSGKCKTLFNSGDSTSATSWTDVDVFKTGELNSSLWEKASTMFKNLRYLYSIAGLINTKILDYSAKGYSYNESGLGAVVKDINSELKNFGSYIGAVKVTPEPLYAIVIGVRGSSTRGRYLAFELKKKNIYAYRITNTGVASCEVSLGPETEISEG